MATKMARWLKVIGILSAVAMLLAIGLAFGSFFFLRSSFRQFEAADHSFDAVAGQYGGITSYRPAPDGTIGAEQLEAFLASRDRVGPHRERVEHVLTLLSNGDAGRAGGALRKFRGTIGLLRNLAPFHRARNEALIESEVGLGEYYYLYTLAYYSWLGKSPADGPPFKIVGEKGYLLENIEKLEESAVRRYREQQARRSLNRMLLPVLRNQLADLSTQQERSGLSAFEKILASEIAKLEADKQRLPWEDGLPETLEQSLRPYSERLSESYSVQCNAIEIGLARRSPHLAASDS